MPTKTKILRLVRSGRVAGDDGAVFTATEEKPLALVLIGNQRFVGPAIFGEGEITWITAHGHAIPIGADGKPASAAGKAILGGDKGGATSRKDVVEHSQKAGLEKGHTDALVRAYGAGGIQTHEHLVGAVSSIKSAHDAASEESRGKQGYHSRQTTKALAEHGADKKSVEAFKQKRSDRIFGKLPKIHAAIPKLRASIEKDMAKDGLSKDRVAAVVSSIIDKTTMRVGSEAGATKLEKGKGINENSQDSFGASSLRKSHVTTEGDTVHFKFAGKSRHEWERSITDPHLAKAIRELQSLPGEKLMQYHDENGNVKPFNETHVRDYMKPHGITPKNVRTHHGTEAADTFLRSLPAPKDAKTAEKDVTSAVEHTSNLLGNTPAVARGSYIHPVVLDAHRARVKGSADMSKPGEGDDFGKRLEELRRQVEAGELDSDGLDEDAADDEDGLDPKHREQQEKEAAASKEDGGFSSPASFSSGAELASSMALPAGDYVTRSGKVFHEGVFEDKNFALSSTESPAAVASFKPVAANLEHRSSPVDGALGGLAKMWQQGKELFGLAVIPRWLDDHLKKTGKPLQPSLEWNRETKQVTGVAWTNFPRIEDAALMSAFSADVKEDTATVWFDDAGAEFAEMGDVHVDKPLGDEDDETEDDDEEASGKPEAKFMGGEMNPVRDMHDHSVRLGAECGGQSHFSDLAKFMTPEELKKIQKVHDLTSGDDNKHCDAMASRKDLIGYSKFSLEGTETTTSGGSPARKDSLKMNWKQRLSALFRKAGVPEDEITETMKDAPDISPTSDFSADSVDFSKNPLFVAMQQTADALKTQNEALAKQNADFSKKFEEIEGSAQFAKDEAELRLLARIPNNKITAAELEDYKEIAKTQPAVFAVLLPILQKREPLAMFSTIRASNGAMLDEVDDKLDKLTRARMEQTKESYQAAFSAVCAEHKDLAASHEAQFTEGN